MEVKPIEYAFTDCYELQLIDCNCNNCFFMKRDLEKYAKWAEWHKGMALTEFEREKKKAIEDARFVIDRGIKEVNDSDVKSGNGMMRVALKMRFQFDKSILLQYGHCEKFDKPVSFIPVTCQIETRKCFQHRKDVNC